MSKKDEKSWGFRITSETGKDKATIEIPYCPKCKHILFEYNSVEERRGSWYMELNKYGDRKTLDWEETDCEAIENVCGYCRTTVIDIEITSDFYAHLYEHKDDDRIQVSLDIENIRYLSPEKIDKEIRKAIIKQNL